MYQKILYNNLLYFGIMYVYILRLIRTVFIFVFVNSLLLLLSSLEIKITVFVFSQILPQGVTGEFSRKLQKYRMIETIYCNFYILK